MQTNADKCRSMPINTQIIANKRRGATQSHTRPPQDLSQGVGATLHKMLGDVQPVTGESLKNGYLRNMPKI